MIVGPIGRSSRVATLEEIANALQVLGWDGTGRALWTKRLDRGVFELPTARAGNKSGELREAAFEALFHGLRRTPIH